MMKFRPRQIRDLFLLVLLAWPLVQAAANQAAAKTPGDPAALYGPVAEYDILRDGETVGTHRIDFHRSGQLTIVESRSQIVVPFLFFTAYRFEYQARSVWRDGNMIELTATTNDDGTLSRMSLRQDGGKVLLDGPDGRQHLDATPAPTEHWSMQFLHQTMLNTITGRINQVTLTPLSDAFVPASLGMLKAQRFRLDGDLKLETWYDQDGRWLGMRFAAKDGSSIEYRCRTCADQVATTQ